MNITSNYTPALKRFIENIIEFRSTKVHGYSLFVDQLQFSEQKLFLSHILSAEDYADACQSYSLTLEYINDLRQVMQEMLDDALNDIYVERMKDHDCYIYQHSNGDRSWIRR